MSGDVFVTVERASEMLNVHPQTVRRWLRTGQIQGTMLSRQAGYRIRLSEVEHVLTEGLRAGKPLVAA